MAVASSFFHVLVSGHMAKVKSASKEGYKYPIRGPNTGSLKKLNFYLTWRSDTFNQCLYTNRELIISEEA
jgi:hypothetical protein